MLRINKRNEKRNEELMVYKKKMKVMKVSPCLAVRSFKTRNQAKGMLEVP